MKLVATIAAVFTVAVAGESYSSGTATSAAAKPSHVTIYTKDYSFVAPAEVDAGWVRLDLVNRGKEPHQAQVIRLENGKTLADFQAAMQNPTSGYASWTTYLGGPNAAGPGKQANATMYLSPGNYVLLCFIPSPDGKPHFMKGMIQPLRVRAVKQPRGTEPRADVTMRLVDYGFELSKPLRRGPHTIKVWTNANQPHEVVLLRLKPGKTAADFGAWGAKMQGPPPGDPAGGVVGLHRGQVAYFDVHLTRGRYGLICFFPDAQDGKPHFVHGMTRDITVR